MSKLAVLLTILQPCVENYECCAQRSSQSDYSEVFSGTHSKTGNFKCSRKIRDKSCASTCFEWIFLHKTLYIYNFKYLANTQPKMKVDNYTTRKTKLTNKVKITTNGVAAIYPSCDVRTVSLKL